MHHEDRAGVNSLIRGVDEVAAERLPIAIVMCTNRLDAIDPAVHRRAAAVFEFRRPDRQQRIAVLRTGLHGTAIPDREIEAIADATGESDERSYGFTYSDLTQRLIPAIVLDAFPERSVAGPRALEMADRIKPTPPFRSHGRAS
jgi:AAA+ superfamily predicted ATPase